MDVNLITTLIGSLGFPIAAACALFWYMVTESRQTRETISNNTVVMTQILEHVKHEEEKDGEK